MPSGQRFDDPRIFSSQAAFRAWLEKHHGRAPELWVGFWNKASGRKGMTYSEAVDEALCWGWIDGVKKKVDAERYTNRFTPRKAVSTWSDLNLRRYAELEAVGRVAPPGKEAFARFDPSKHRVPSSEARPDAFPPELEREFRRHPEAWTFFATQPPGYRRIAIGWVTAAKREDTRLRRLAQLVQGSEAGERLAMLGGGAARKREV